ncbi:MAG: orotidine-5'-phosphate decarboxylase [Desulfovibrionaceae bacterium]|nr:orotidine-5'-phosphate decarboxylase [Desulfovibrionaceae bacterium]
MAELVVALDFDDALDALNMATVLRGQISWVKVGLELFTMEGPRMLHSLKGLGYRVFLDLKLHDIPNTVSRATLACAKGGADLITVHLMGGEHMCRAALDALRTAPSRPLVFGVTVLTSLAEGELPGCQQSLPDLTRTLADHAEHWGLDGVVCSGRECAAIKAQHPDLRCLTPGIRMDYDGADDQKRVMTPAQAVASGSDFLVVGRPITRAADPVAAAAAILADMNAPF